MKETLNFRTKEYSAGFAVEIQKRRWYGLKYWTTFIPKFFDSNKQAQTALENHIDMILRNGPK